MLLLFVIPWFLLLVYSFVIFKTDDKFCGWKILSIWLVFKIKVQTGAYAYLLYIPIPILSCIVDDTRNDNDASEIYGCVDKTSGNFDTLDYSVSTLLSFTFEILCRDYTRTIFWFVFPYLVVGAIPAFANFWWFDVAVYIVLWIAFKVWISLSMCNQSVIII